MKKNLIKVYIELPETENGLADLDDLSWTLSYGNKVREAVHNEIEKYLFEKYKDTVDFTINKEEVREEVKKRLVDAMVDKAMGKENDY